MSYPRLNPALLLSPVEDGYVAYDAKRDWLHQLNPIAALLAELADGTRSPEEIRALVAPLLPPDRAATIDQWFENGKKVGLLTEEESGETVRELTADELLGVTKKLRQVGAVQPRPMSAASGWWSWRRRIGTPGMILAKSPNASASATRPVRPMPIIFRRPIRGEDGEIEASADRAGRRRAAAARLRPGHHCTSTRPSPPATTQPHARRSEICRAWKS